MTTIELGPLPEPRVSFGPAAAMIRLAPGDYYTADQMRAYAMQERAEESELAAQHIAALEREIARQKEVIGSVNARCDHLGMSLRDIKADRDSWAQQASDRTQDAVDLVAAERERHADALRCALDALDHCCDDTTGRHRAVAQRLREMLNG